jgi:hypothetical protein
MIVDAPWYVPNTVIRRDLQIPTVQEEIRRYSSQYSARLSAHSNDPIVNLTEQPDNRRLSVSLRNVEADTIENNTSKRYCTVGHPQKLPYYCVGN